ncbi:MAG: putative sugar O-methyltransferase [Verrucomicrobiota bacterium]
MFNLTAVRTLAWFYLGKLKQGHSIAAPLEPETNAYLKPANPVLLDLRSRYEQVQNPGHSCWSVWEPRVNLRRFRAENNYLSQANFRHSMNRYRLSAAYLEMIDDHGWLHSLEEDSKFGVKLWCVDRNLMLSRDLLDSILELHWLKECLGWNLCDSISVLDIGAGYGRFAHRFTHAFPNGRITCLDAIATSTFLCDFYLKYRRCERWKVVPFDRISELDPGDFMLATNIHSWSEMPLAWVRLWLDLLTDLHVPYLFVVPNFEDLRTKEIDGSSGDYGHEIERHGYTCLVKNRKYRRSSLVDRFGVFPTDYYLFKRNW